MGPILVDRFVVENVSLLRPRKQDIFELLKQGPPEYNPSNAVEATLRYNRTDRLGRGTCKVAIKATMLSVEMSGSGDIVIKRMIESISVDNFGREMIAFKKGHAESLAVLQEANMYNWARALMDFAYEFVDGFIKQHGAPPFVIPRLQMVDFFIAARRVTGNSGGTTSGGSYLLEELIDESLEGPWIKYINNTSSIPVVKPGERGFDIAQFLSCVQHVQYIHTSRLVFVSDFQGSLSSF